MTTSRGEGAPNVIRVNATSIDVSSSNAIAFGYENELARAGRIIAGRHRLKAPLADRLSGNASSSSASLGKTSLGDASSNRASPRATQNVSRAREVVSGRVWGAESLWHGATVLVELLDPAIADDPALADAFEWEVRAAAAVTSPFVNRVLDFGIECNTPFLITEMPYGDSLASRVRSGRRPGPLELERILSELAHALDEMHELGVMHRDLRSERVFLYRPSRPGAHACEAANQQAAPRNDGMEREVMTLSFGISKLMNDTLELARTMARRPVSPADTPQYSSPEQVLGTSPVGPQSDLWSLAVVAFECLTGEMPFSGKTMGERLVQICTGQPRVPSSICRVPHGFDAWFARGVKKDPESRYTSAREMAEAFGSLVSG
jgi:eukaryotic-like serine/threonine-protein kinase